MIKFMKSPVQFGVQILFKFRYLNTGSWKVADTFLEFGTVHSRIASECTLGFYKTAL